MQYSGDYLVELDEEVVHLQKALDMVTRQRDELAACIEQLRDAWPIGCWGVYIGSGRGRAERAAWRRANAAVQAVAL